MNAQGLGRLGVGLLGLWAFIQALLVFPRVATAVPFQYAEHGAYAALVAMALPFVLLLALSFLLVFRAAAVASRLLAPPDNEPTSPAPDLSCVLVGLVGLFILLNSLPGLLQAWTIRTGFEVAVSLRLRVWVASLAQAGVGLFMVLRPAVLVDLWQSPRPASPSGGAV